MGRRGKSKYEQYVSCLKENPSLYRAVERMETIRDDAFCLVCTHVMAPALGGFVLWLIKEAVKSKKDRLYFLARDGYLLYRMTQFFCERYRIPIECRYLSCSRYSVRIPIFHLNQEEALEYLCGRGVWTSPERILRRAGLTREERQKVGKQANLERVFRKELSGRGLRKMRKRLEGCPLFFEYMNQHSQKAMAELFGYLKQEGLFDGVRDALVDSGWVGSMQKALQTALSHMGRERRLEGYYWGLYELPKGAKREEYHCYFFEPYRGLREKVYFNNCLFEAICTAPHGMTMGYRREGEFYFPCYGNMDEQRKEFVRKTEAWIMEYARSLAQEMGKEGLFRQSVRKDRNTGKKLLRLFMTTPSREEAAWFGQLSFSDDVLEEEGNPIARPMTKKELRANHFLPRLLRLAGWRKQKNVVCAWYEGCVVLSGKQAKRHLRQYILCQYARYAVKQGLGTKRKQGGREA